jgi:DNA polymerase elongation subunit (family B)
LAQIRIVDVVSQMNNALGSLAITEGVLRNKFRDMENIVLYRDEKGDAEATIAGGWVKDPVVGMNQWCVTYDFASLYPTTQRQFFIAPETFVGVQDPNKKDFCDNGRPIDLEKHVLCVNGVVFEKRKSPIFSSDDYIFTFKTNSGIEYRLDLLKHDDDKVSYENMYSVLFSLVENDPWSSDVLNYEKTNKDPTQITRLLRDFLYYFKTYNL